MQDVAVEGVSKLSPATSYAGSRIPATATRGTDIASGGRTAHWISAATLIGSLRRNRKNRSV